MSENTYTIKIKSTYIKLRSFYVGAEAMRNSLLSPGQIVVTIKDDKDFLIEGTLQPEGLLTGMTKLYRKLNLKEGDTLSFSISDTGDIVVNNVKDISANTSNPAIVENSLPPIPLGKTVFERKNLKRIHIEVFRPENLKNWGPETEVDVYMVFGVLQQYTDYLYCCGASVSLLKKLGANYTETSKPDAILIDKNTDEYLIAEWKKFSSDYSSNHKPDDVDIIVCWEDNETDRSKLPARVLELQSIAKTATSKMLIDY